MSIIGSDKLALGRRLRAVREERGLSMRELASRAGIAVSFVSKIESGKTSPTIMSLGKILEALGTDVPAFFADRAPADGELPIVFPRAGMKALAGDDRVWWYAFPSRPEVKLMLTYEEYAPRSRVLEQERHATDVCGLVLDGTLTLDVAGTGKVSASEGDAFYLRAGKRHVARNDGRKKLRLVVVQLRST